MERLETAFIHGAVREGYTDKKGAVNVPMYLSSTFHQESIDEFGEYDYSRSGNPTRAALEKMIAELEGGDRGFAFATGMASVSACLMLLSAGDHIVITEDVYGGSYRFVTKILPRLGITHTFVDFTDIDAVEAAITPATKLLFMETPSNPTLKITDIAAVTATPALSEQLYFIQNSFGNVLGVQDCYTLIQNMKTTAVRFNHSSQVAAKIAQFLNDHPLVEKVYYPGLPSHPGRQTHFEQSTSGGAVLSFQLPNYEITKKFVAAMKIPVFAVSLGGVESILSYPAKMSHAAMEPAEREKRGITDGLLRFSVGLEHEDDLLADFEQALYQASLENLNV